MNSVEVMRCSSPKAYEECRMLSGDIFRLFQSPIGDLFIGRYQSGCWCEIPLSELTAILNYATNSLSQYEAEEYDRQINL